MNQENTLAAVLSLSLELLNNAELAQLNNAVQLYGVVDPLNIAFDRAVNLSLISPSGLPLEKESLIRALTFEVNQRASEGAF